MNQLKFNKFERVAGLFVGIAIIGFFASLFGVAIKQGWFDTKVYFTTVFINADGIHVGTSVQMAGLKAGSVESVELTADNKIKVRFYVLSKFQDKIRQDSAAQLIRPFVIGERVLDIALGSEGIPKLSENSTINSQESVDLLSLISGKQLGAYLKSMEGMMENFKTLAEAFLDKKRTENFVKMYDRIDPLLKNLNSMSVEVIKLSQQATKNENLGVVLGQLATTTKELNSLIPEMNQRAPQMAKEITQLVSNLALLTEEFKVVIPALAEVAPDLPQASRRAVVALDEAVVLIKAMQKSFFVRSSAQEVREEEAQAAKAKALKNQNESRRQPAEDNP